jgi:hypothetical protein
MLGRQDQHKFVRSYNENYTDLTGGLEYLLQLCENYQSYKISLYDINVIVT